MKKLYKEITERIIAHQTRNTPRADYLSHYYWSNKVWSKLGVLIAFSILLISLIFFSVNFWFLILSFLPFITSYLAGSQKEKRDATGLGNADENDIYYTVLPSYFDVVYLFIIITLINLI